jgi:hypothetical protein
VEKLRAIDVQCGGVSNQDGRADPVFLLDDFGLKVEGLVSRVWGLGFEKLVVSNFWE